MEVKLELLINKYGQNIIEISELISQFNFFSFDDKKQFLEQLLFLILQSKPIENDIEIAIFNSYLKPTYTPCVLLKKGIKLNNLEKIINLPEKELDKVFVLLMELFKVSYQRRFLIEKNNPEKWWYWDLSDEKNVDEILIKYT